MKRKQGVSTTQLSHSKNIYICMCVYIYEKWKWSRSVVSDSLRPHGHQAPPPMGFSRQEYWSGLPFPSPGIFLTQGWNLGLLHHRQMLYHLSHQGSNIYISEPLKSHSVKPPSSIPNKNRILGAGDPDIKKAFFVVDIHPPEIQLAALEVRSQA